MNFLEILFYFCEIILIWQKGFLKTLFEYYFFNIIVNVNFFSDLKLNITVSTTLRYCYETGGAMKYFLKKLLGHEISRSMVSWATNVVLKNL